MGKILTHDAVASGVFDRDYTSGWGQLSAWESQLTNSPEVLELLTKRMELDYSSLNPKQRKAYGGKETDFWMRSEVLFLLWPLYM